MNVVEASDIGEIGKDQRRGERHDQVGTQPGGPAVQMALVADDRTENGADDQAYEKLGVQSHLSVGPGVVA